MKCQWCEVEGAVEIVSRDEFGRTTRRWICPTCIRRLQRLEDDR